jgi:lipoic acid synthetase
MKRRRHPDWIKTRIGGGTTYASVRKQLRDAHVHTICEEAKCPNIGECFSRGTATFLILGDTCTRNCLYCNVSHGTAKPLDSNEPFHIAKSVQKLKLTYAVITSVTRDDLDDGGAQHFKETIDCIKKLNPNCNVEVLIPDFNGNDRSLRTVLSAKPTILNHNIEVVSSLFDRIRPQGNYTQSLTLLKNSKEINPKIPTKSGFMLGIGEDTSEILTLLDDLRSVDVDFLTIGQYLQPSADHIPVKKYYSPHEFKFLKEKALEKGFCQVESAPLVRSSYHAESFL